MNIKKYMVTGILSIIPIYLTYIISKLLFQFFSKPGAKFFDYIYALFGKDSVKFLPDIFGFIGVLLIIYLIGMLVSSLFVKNILFSLERIISGIPVVNILYKTIKQITSSLGDPNKESFKKVVLIEYPRKDLWTLAMVTGESKDKDSNEYYNIYVPTTPNPTSGFMLYALKREVLETEIPVEEGLKIIISGGVIGPSMNGIKKNV